MFKTIMTATALTFATVGGASAVTYGTLDFSGPENWNLGNPVDLYGIDVSASAWGLLNDSAAVSQSGAGLGVFGAPDTTPTQVDGFPVGSGEMLTFTFPWTVKLTALTLSLFDGDDEFDYDIVGPVNYSGTSSDGSWNGSILTDSFSISAVGSFFEGDGWFFGLGPNDDFAVKSIAIAPVPLPAGGVLLLSALAGVGLLRRRKTAA